MSLTFTNFEIVSGFCFPCQLDLFDFIIFMLVFFCFYVVLCSATVVYALMFLFLLALFGFKVVYML